MARHAPFVLSAVLALLVGCSSVSTGGGTGTGSSSGGGSGGTSSGGASGDGSTEQLCVDTINQYRATLSLPPYARWNAEESCADGQAASDSQSGTAHGAFGQCSESAQDECPGWPGPPSTMITQCLAQMWAEGPGPFAQHGHYDNMSDANYTQVACGFTTLSDGSVWATQDFR
ncbi:MAG TPA: CAP domain-containing protein [Polyangiaceae bacterium]|jgi:hypothetical protein